MKLFHRKKTATNKQTPVVNRVFDDVAFDDSLEQINEAREQFRLTKDPVPAIEVYERCLPDLGNAVAHHLFLADLYIRNNQNDKAWGYLNKLLLEYPAAESRIRESQYKLLKREKRWLDAIGMLLYYHINKPTFSPDGFVKDATPLAEKLGLADTDMKILASTAKENAHDTLSANKVFTAFCQFRGLS